MVLVGITRLSTDSGGDWSWVMESRARFAFVPLLGALLFGGLVAAATANWRNPEWSRD